MRPQLTKSQPTYGVIDIINAIGSLNSGIHDASSIEQTTADFWRNKVNKRYECPNSGIPDASPIDQTSTYL